MKNLVVNFVAVAALALHSPVQGNTEKGLKEATAEINATLAKARCPETRAEVPDTAYTFKAVPRSRLVRIKRSDPKGAANRRIETIEVSVYQLKPSMGITKDPRPGIDPEFSIDLGCNDFSHCVAVVEIQGRSIKSQRAVRGKFLPLCGLTNSETTRLVNRIRDTAAMVRAGN